MTQKWTSPPPGFVKCPRNQYSPCPHCQTSLGFASAGWCYQDKGAQAFYEKHWKDGGYQGGCEMFDGDMIKSHKSRFGMMKCVKCGCLIWHNWKAGYDKHEIYRGMVHWFRPPGARTVLDFMREGKGVR